MNPKQCLAILLCGLTLTFLFQCSMLLAPSDVGLEEPPLPRLKSILPLEMGNHWIYSFSYYDSVGDQVRSGTDDNLEDSELDLEITGVFGWQNDTTLVPLSSTSQWDTLQFTEFVYKYEWENIDSGYLVTYRDVGVDTSGVYVVGEYKLNTTALYDTAKLWLAYPADSGISWSVNFDSSNHPDSARQYQLISTSEQFYLADTLYNNMSPLRFVNCYVYKMTHQNKTTLQYYNSDFGAVAYSSYYASGRLQTTYLLMEFRNRQYSYYR